MTFQGLYTGDGPNNFDEAKMLLPAARKYDVPNLFLSCAEGCTTEKLLSGALDNYREAIRTGNEDMDERYMGVICAYVHSIFYVLFLFRPRKIF